MSDTLTICLAVAPSLIRDADDAALVEMLGRTARDEARRLAAAPSQLERREALASKFAGIARDLDRAGISSTADPRYAEVVSRWLDGERC